MVSWNAVSRHLTLCLSSGIIELDISEVFLLSCCWLATIWVHSSGGEHFLDTEGAVGSNPTVPTSKIKGSGKPELLVFAF